MEYVDVYNKFGEKTGEVVPKLRAHELGLYHKAVHVWIVNIIYLSKYLFKQL